MEKLPDLNIADDRALSCDQLVDAQKFLMRVETECAKTDLHIKTRNTWHTVLSEIASEIDCNLQLNVEVGSRMKDKERQQRGKEFIMEHSR